MIEDFFDHRCDIFHIRENGASPGYGLPDSPGFSYPDTPDISGLACHFGIRSDSTEIVQGEPANSRVSATKLTLPAGTDVRLNDRIVDADTGYAYTAEIPHNIRGHHIFVRIRAKDEWRQRDL